MASLPSGLAPPSTFLSSSTNNWRMETSVERLSDHRNRRRLRSSSGGVNPTVAARAWVAGAMQRRHARYRAPLEEPTHFISVAWRRLGARGPHTLPATVELGGDERGVNPACSEEILVPPRLRDPAPLEHDDPVGVGDRAEPVGDDDPRATER